ncbi:hypothetical protein S83_053228 [Arachis hypogaea]
MIAKVLIFDVTPNALHLLYFLAQQGSASQTSILPRLHLSKERAQAIWWDQSKQPNNTIRTRMTNFNLFMYALFYQILNTDVFILLLNKVRHVSRISMFIYHFVLF